MGIGVILTAYKRTHLLERQLEAVRGQTVQYDVLFIWGNNAQYEAKLAPFEYRIDAGVNLGVWPRFLVPLMTGSDVIFVFDDDTIPGPKWFESCLSILDKHGPALLGGVGVVFPDGHRAERAYCGWKYPTDQIVRADIVGHAWCAPKALFAEYAKIMADGMIETGITCGEDYALSLAAQRLGWPVLCPPHPENDKSVWSSLDGDSLGEDGHALWKTPGEEKKKWAAHQLACDKGWTMLVERQRKGAILP